MHTTGREVPNSTSPSTGVFRPDIEGLRACAVVLVLLYHSGVPWISGGFIGVDVFFVISGFLITGLLMREMRERDTLSLVNFYGRRIRRLVPASILVVTVTLIVAKLVLPPLLVPGVARDGIASSLDVVNMWLGYNGTDYLGDQTPSLFQHYWSLAVEEQFYLVWPVVVLLVARARRNRDRRTAAWTVGFTVLSLMLCIWMTGEHRGWAYLLLPTRAWELGAGALLALSAPLLARTPGLWRALIGWLGLAVIVACAVSIESTMSFPGWIAVVPVIGAVAVIAAGRAELGPRLVLDLAPMQFLGRISYSLYLWHWPVLVVPTLVWVRPLTWFETVAAIAVSLALSWLTFLYVEEPFRKSKFLVERKPRTFASGAVAIGVAVVVALLVSQLPRLTALQEAREPTVQALATGEEFPSFVPLNVTPTLADAGDDLPPVYANGCEAAVSVEQSPECVSGDVNSQVKVVLFGDSRASQWYSAVDIWARDNGAALITMTKSGCPPADIPVLVYQVDRPFPECDAFRRNAVARISQIRPALVVMSGYGDGYQSLWTGSGDYSRAYAAGVSATIGRLGSPVVVLGDTPTWGQSPAVCLSANLDTTENCVVPRASAVDADVLAATGDSVRAASASFVDPSSWLCSEVCGPLAGNMLLYRDDRHIGDLTARRLQPLISQALSSYLSHTRPGE